MRELYVAWISRKTVKIDYNRRENSHSTTQPTVAIFTTLSLFNALAVTAPHLLSPFLARQPSPPWKSQIAHLDMHHLVFGINFQIHFVSLVSPVSIHLLIHLSTHPCHHRHSQHPSLHSFTPVSKPTSLTNPSHLNFNCLLIVLPSRWWDWTALIMLISLFFFISPYSVAFGVVLSLLYLFICTVEDISTQDGAIGVKFWLRVEQTPGTGTR